MDTILLADNQGHYDAALALFRRYADWLGVDLHYQGFEEELTRLPAIYGPPAGALALARRDGRFVGCCAVRRLGDDETCELKRLWVEPEATGGGLGRRLCTRIVEEARRIGYRRMRLDTLPKRMIAAGRIYTGLGFVEIPAYYANPIPGVGYFELDLTRSVT